MNIALTIIGYIFLIVVVYFIIGGLGSFLFEQMEDANLSINIKYNNIFSKLSNLCFIPILQIFIFALAIILAYIIIMSSLVRYLKNIILPNTVKIKDFFNATIELLKDGRF